MVIKAKVLAVPDEPDEPLSDPQIRELYSDWSEKHPARLRRDSLRWKYWNWHFRMCSPFQDGYLCYEPGMLREIIYSQPVEKLPVPDDCEWLGLSSMVRLLQINIEDPKPDLHFMGYNIPQIPQMFMTDQF